MPYQVTRSRDHVITAGMSINILDIMYIIQFKILAFIALPKLLQQLARTRRNKFCAIIAIIFIYPSQVLLDYVYTLKHSAFKNL